MHGVSGQVQGPQASKDGAVAQTVVTYNLGSQGWNKLPDTVTALKKITAVDGVSVHFAGPGGQANDSAEAFAGLDGTLLFASLGVVILILLFTYRSPILWILPIISAVVALGVSEGIIYFLAKDAGLTVNSQSSAILTVLVIGAGTDYALLLTARYREELRRHDDRHEAMAFALHRATPAIIASASTVAIGMLCLMFAEMNSTARPRAGQRDRRHRHPGRDDHLPARPAGDLRALDVLAEAPDVRVGGAHRDRHLGQGRSRHRAAAAPGLGRDRGGSRVRRPQRDSAGLPRPDHGRPVHQALRLHRGCQQLLSEHGLVDDSTPIQIVAKSTATDQVTAALAKVPGLSAPDTSVPPIAGVQLISVTSTGDIASQAAFDKVRQVRAAVHAVPGADALVGGASATYLDVQTASHRDNKVIIPIVLLVVLVILMLLLRALVAPLLLILTVVLSFGTALGLSTFLFQHLYTHVFSNGDGFHYTDPSFPLFVFVFLVALGIDYNIFLMTRVREETLARGTRQGSLVALVGDGRRDHLGRAGAGVDVRGARHAALVFIAELGTAVALGVILDTIIVRSVLVTALNLDLGGKIWWPSRLDRGHDESPVEAAEKVDALEG